MRAIALTAARSSLSAVNVVATLVIALEKVGADMVLEAAASRGALKVVVAVIIVQLGARNAHGRARAPMVAAA